MRSVCLPRLGRHAEMDRKFGLERGAEQELFISSRLHFAPSAAG